MPKGIPAPIDETPEQRLARIRANKRRYYERNKAACVARAAAYNKAHPDKFKEANDNWVKKTKQDKPQEWKKKRSAHAKRFYERHTEEVKTKASIYRAANPEQVILTQRKTDARPERKEDITTRTRQRRALKARSPLNDFTAQDWREMQTHYNHCCVYCGKRAKGKLTQDHITPLSKGGAHTKGNIVPACQSCNSKKRTGPPLKPVQPLLL